MRGLEKEGLLDQKVEGGKNVLIQEKKILQRINDPKYTPINVDICIRLRLRRNYIPSVVLS